MMMMASYVLAFFLAFSACSGKAADTDTAVSTDTETAVDTDVVGLPFGCPCSDADVCADGLVCYAYGTGSLCSALCVEGVCEADPDLGCNNQDPPACMRPSAASCP